MKHLTISLSLILFFLAALLPGTGPLKAQETVKIGKQVWMKENLAVRSFRNGDSIPVAVDLAAWKNAVKTKTPAMCFYENNSISGEKYGVLYNWYAVNDPRGLAPAGWHVASDSEWQTLVDFLGMDMIAGEKLKNKTGWKENQLGNYNGTNSSGFTALPGGMRNYGGRFSQEGTTGLWWSATGSNETLAWLRSMSANTGKVVTRSSFPKTSALSVRCVKD